VVKAEELALTNGVEIVRIQTSDRAASLWSELYAELAERHPRTLGSSQTSVIRCSSMSR
jgi:hypothetical protein